MGFKLEIIMSYLDFNQFCDLIRGSGGDVFGVPQEWKNVVIEIKKSSKGSKFFFDSKSRINSLSIVDYWGGNEIHVGENSKLTGGIKIGLNCKLVIGDLVSFTAKPMFHISESTSLVIGDDCMFGSGVSFYTHDYHPIYDLSTKNRLNISKDIYIGNHVWCANNSVILKGAKIGNGSILGAYSICGSEIPDNCVAAGNPAEVKRENIFWTRDSFNSTKFFGLSNI